MRFFKRKPHVIKFSTDPGISHVEWRKDLELVTSAQRLVTNPDFKAAYATLIASRPSRSNLPLGLTSHQLASQAMFTAGYEYALDILLSLAKPVDQETEETPTFEDQ
jgi:hypothetical protein